MNINDFKNAQFKELSEISLSEWVLGNEHYPKVKVYINEETGEVYQVSEKHKKYRKTEPNKGYSALPYGDWLDLN